MVQRSMDDISHLREKSLMVEGIEKPLQSWWPLWEVWRQIMTSLWDPMPNTQSWTQFYCRVCPKLKNICSKILAMKNYNSQRLKTPSNAQKHGLAHNDAGKSSSKRKRQGTKRENQVETFPHSPLVERLFQQNEPGVARNPIFLRRERGRNLRVLWLKNSRRLSRLPLMVK